METVPRDCPLHYELGVALLDCGLYVYCTLHYDIVCCTVVVENLARRKIGEK